MPSRTTSAARTCAADLHGACTAQRPTKNSRQQAVARQRRRPHDAQARHGQGQLRHAAGHERAHPALRQRRRIGAEAHEEFKHWDLGDIVGAEGTLFRTKTGELTIQRHLDCACSPSRCGRCRRSSTASTDQEAALPPALRRPDHQRRSRARSSSSASSMIQAIRDVHGGRGYLEVETPMMHPIPGGAAAKPFGRTTTRSTWSCTCASRRSCT